MAIRVRASGDLAEFRQGVLGIGHYFGWHPAEEEAERFSRLLPFERMHVACEGTRVVGGAGAFPFRLSVPGGTAACAGVTMVGVHMTHRRQGILSRLMDAQLRDVRDRGEPIAALYATEETIYGRFGYGMAAVSYRMRLPRRAAGLHGARPRGIRARLVETEEAGRLFPGIYRKAARGTPGMVERTAVWWSERTLEDSARRRRGGGPLQALLVERDGAPAGYALYRIAQDASGGEWVKTLRVAEAIGIDDAALIEVWRYLLAVDWIDTIEAGLLPVDHPLLLTVTRMNEAGFMLFDGVWVRVVDVSAALATRSYASDGRVGIEVTGDPHFSDNVGVWQVGAGGVERGRGRPDVRLPVASLGAVYLGGFTFAQLARAGLAEGTAAGLAKADALFRTARAPWCPEAF